MTKLKQGQTVYLVVIDRVGALVHKIFVRDKWLLRELNQFNASGKVKIYTSKRKAIFGANTFTKMLQNGVFGKTLMQQDSATIL